MDKSPITPTAQADAIRALTEQRALDALNILKDPASYEPLAGQPTHGEETMSNPLDVEDVVERLKAIETELHKHTSNPPPAGKHARIRGDLLLAAERCVSQAASLLTSQAERIAELEKERNDAWVNAGTWAEACDAANVKLDAAEARIAELEKGRVNAGTWSTLIDEVYVKLGAAEAARLKLVEALGPCRTTTAERMGCILARIEKHAENWAIERAYQYSYEPGSLRYYQANARAYKAEASFEKAVAELRAAIAKVQP